MSVAVDGDGDTFVVGATTKMFQTAYELGTSFDVQPDGERFLFTEITVNDETPISLVFNWNDLLKR